MTKGAAEKRRDSFALKADIQTWTQLFLGYRSAETLSFYERLQGDATTAQRLVQRLVKRHANFRRLFLKSVFIRKNDRTYYNKKM